MTTDLVLRGGDMIRSVADLMAISEMLVKSGMLPTSIKTKEAAAAIILKGREIGMPMMESFSLINVIQGKPTIAPQGMIALARRTRELEYLKVENNPTNTATTVRVKRKGEPEFVTTFSDEDAKAMQLLNKDNWQKQRPVMRQWRAVSANLRITFADVIGGMYVPEEMGALVDDEGEIVDGATVEFTPTQNEAVMVTPIPVTPNIPAPLNVSPLPAPVTVPSHAPTKQAERTHPPLSPVQRKKLAELYQAIHGEMVEEEVVSALDALFINTFQHGYNEATYEEGARLTGQLLAVLRNKQPV
jgi:hypothetical protein